METVQMKTVELYGSPFDGMVFKLPTHDCIFVYEFVSLVDGMMVFLDYYYQSFGEVNSRGNEKFFFIEESSGFVGGI